MSIFMGYLKQKLSLLKDRSGTIQSIVEGVHVFSNSISPNVNVILFTNPSAMARYDTRSVLKWSLTGLNSEFSFS